MMDKENPLRRLFNMLGQQDEEHFEPLAPLSKQEVEEWNQINNQTAEARLLMEEAEAKRKIFWAKIERKAGIFDRNMRIENGMVLIQTQEKSNCKSNGKAVPGFCDGDCDNCALGADHEGGPLG